QRDQGDEDIAEARLPRAPPVAEELAARPATNASLDALEQIGRSVAERLVRQRPLEQVSHGRVVALVVLGRRRFRHSIFSPSARSTISLSCARARWMRLLTVPSGSPV